MFDRRLRGRRMRCQIMKYEMNRPGEGGREGGREGREGGEGEKSDQDEIGEDSTTAKHVGSGREGRVFGEGTRV